MNQDNATRAAGSSAPACWPIFRRNAADLIWNVEHGSISETAFHVQVCELFIAICDALAVEYRKANAALTGGEAVPSNGVVGGRMGS